MSAGTDFWTRRKAEVRAEAKAADAVREAERQETELKSLEEKPDEEILAELELPDPDTMNSGDDFGAFMTKAVPDRIRRRALRRLWLSDPLLANVDGLVEYGEDFTDAATVVENLQTVYQVGKGMLRHTSEQSDADIENIALDDDEDRIAEANAQNAGLKLAAEEDGWQDDGIGVCEDSNPDECKPEDDAQPDVLPKAPRMRFRRVTVTRGTEIK